MWGRLCCRCRWCWRWDAVAEVGMARVSVRLMVRGRVRILVRCTAMTKRCQTSSPAHNGPKPGSKYPV